MKLRRAIWAQDSFSDTVRTWLPDLTLWMQIAAHFSPPDAQGFRPLLYYESTSLEETRWQAEFTILPKLKPWLVPENPVPGKPESEKERKMAFEQAQANKAIFALSISLALIAPVISHAHVTLRCLQDLEWSDVTHAASTIGLLYVGDQDVNLECIPRVFGESKLPEEWRSCSRSESRSGREARLYDPMELPLQIWIGALRTLRRSLNKEDPALSTLLQIAWENPSDELAGEILLMAMDIGLYDEFLHGVAVEHIGHRDWPEPDSRFADSWVRILERGELRSANAQLAQWVQEALERFFK